MTKVHQLGNNYYAVQVPKDYSGGMICNQLLLFNKARWITLPTGIHWEIIGMINALSENQLSDIFPGQDENWLNEAFKINGIEKETTLIIKSEISYN